ncbi:MAG: hypothetical protein JWQ43_886 [Glaciihabitans sp.]|nr:hypothetical protein [Glaciihabitans sp.]
MPTIAALIACAVLLGLAVFQGALATGVPLGRFVWGGQHDVLPERQRRNSVVMIAAYVLFAVILLQGVGILSLFSDTVGLIAIWALTVYFFVNFVLSAMSTSKYEQILMSIVSVALAALSLIVAIAGRVQA